MAKSKLLLAQQYNRLLSKEKTRFHNETGVAQHNYYKRLKNINLFSFVELQRITSWINKFFNTKYSPEELIKSPK